jgi:hypothetical protein
MHIKIHRLNYTWSYRYNYPFFTSILNFMLSTSSENFYRTFPQHLNVEKAWSKSLLANLCPNLKKHECQGKTFDALYVLVFTHKLQQVPERPLGVALWEGTSSTGDTCDPDASSVTIYSLQAVSKCYLRGQRSGRKNIKYRSEKLEITTPPTECRFSAGESN